MVTPAMQSPPAIDALTNVFDEMTVAEGQAILSRTITQVFAEFFAWNSREELGANVVLDKIIEDGLADKIANFLWAHRHDWEGTE